MKKIFLAALFVSVMVSAKAQNLQLHYDMGDGRGYFTSTVEMFKPDKWGSTFFFIDMDYNVGDVEGVSLAYWEIARAIKLGDSPWALHGEYNGGFGQYAPGGSYNIEDAWLAGMEYSMNAPDFSRGLTLMGLYKYIRGKHDASFQLTAVWYWNFAGEKLSFAGFADWWREDFTINGKDTKFVFLAEPQLWYNFNSHFSLGTEIEVNANFAGMDGINVMPTLGVKATF